MADKPLSKDEQDYKDYQDYQDYMASQEAERPKTLKEKIVSGLQTGAKGLDYAGGAVRSTVGAAAGAVTPEELQAGDRGEAMFPDSNEIMKRLKVPEGPKLSKMLPGIYETPGADQADRGYVPNADGDWDPSLRALGGFAADTLTDPLTYVPVLGEGAIANRLMKKLAKSAPALEKLAKIPGAALRTAANPLTKLTGWASDKMYKNGLRQVVREGEKKGKDVVDTYSRHGVKSLDTVGDKAKEIADKLKLERDGILKTADAGGAVVDKGEAMKGFVEKLEKMVADQRITEDQATKLYGEVFEMYAHGADPTTMLASQWKSDIRRGLPGNTWNALRTSAPDIETQLMKELGSGFQKGVEKSVAAKSGTEAGAKLASTNKDLGTFLSTLDKAHAVQATPRKGAMDVWDWLILSGELTPTMGAPLGVFAAKKAYDVYKNPAMQTSLGYFGKKAAASKPFSKALDVGARRTLLKQEKKDGQE